MNPLNETKLSCDWCLKTENMRQYHDEEWGVPVHDDQKHFEFIVLDGFQAGLSWQTILNRREGFRKAFAGFDVAKVPNSAPKMLNALCSTKASSETA